MNIVRNERNTKIINELNKLVDDFISKAGKHHVRHRASGRVVGFQYRLRPGEVMIKGWFPSHLSKSEWYADWKARYRMHAAVAAEGMRGYYDPETIGAKPASDRWDFYGNV